MAVQAESRAQAEAQDVSAEGEDQFGPMLINRLEVSLLREVY